MPAKIVVITGKSAGGKTVLTASLMRFLKKVGTIQSTTTRKRRPDDTDVEYEFISFLSFCWALLMGEFVSWRKATKKWFKTNDLYSVRTERIKEALASDMIYLRSLTPDTILRWYKVAGDKIIFIHLLAPDEEEARRRMRERGGMSEAQIDERIKGEKNWDEDIKDLIRQGIPIHVIPQLSLDEVLQKALEIIRK